MVWNPLHGCRVHSHALPSPIPPHPCPWRRWAARLVSQRFSAHRREAVVGRSQRWHLDILNSPSRVKIFYSDHFVLPLPPGHRFPMKKYRLLREAVSVAGRGEWAELEVPEAVDDRTLLRVHTPEYLDAVTSGRLSAQDQRAIGFPWSPGLVERSRRSVGGTLSAARAALEDGAAANLAGGTHHAFADRGQGFCVFNDVAVAARDHLERGSAAHLAVLDLDVHQGNGTAAIFHSDPRVFTASVHGERNFPFRKEESDLDLPLPDGTEDEPYLEAVGQALEATLARPLPDLLFYVAGADPYRGDRLGRLRVSREGLAHRDRSVLEACWNRGVPVAVVMGGGYAEPVGKTVGIHLHTVESTARTLVPRSWDQSK